MESLLYGLMWWVAVCLATWVIWSPFLLYQRAQAKKQKKQ